MAYLQSSSFLVIQNHDDDYDQNAHAFIFFGKKNFQTGTDCPVTQDYTNYMIDLVTPVLKDVNTA